MNKLVFIIFLVFVFTGIASSQSGAGLGLGGAYSALARGVDAISWNPANLAIHDHKGPAGNMRLYGVMAVLSNNSMNQDIYKEYFTHENKVLSAEDVQRLLAAIPNDGLKIHALGDISLFSIAMKNFGFGFSTTTFMNTTLPKNMLVVPLTGLERDDYLFNAAARFQSVGKISVGFAHNIYKNRTLYYKDKPLIDFVDMAAGISIETLFGIGAFETDYAEMKTVINNSGISANGAYCGRGAVTQNGKLPGMGYSATLGFTATTLDHFTFSLVLKDVFNKIKWRHNVKEYRGWLNTGTPLFIMGENQLEDMESEEYFTDSENKIAGFTTHKTSSVHIGLSRELRNYLYAVETGTEQGDFLFALAGGVKWKIFNFYTSYRYMNDHYFNTAVGLGNKYFMLDAGVGARGGLTQRASKGLLFASSFTFAL